MIKLEKSKIGLYTLKYNNRYIHSKYNPIEESKTMIDKYTDIIKQPIIAVYGLGIGYHIEEILKRNSSAKIYVFEGNAEIINVCKKINNKLFKSNNVEIIFGENIEIYDNLKKVTEQVQEIIIHKSSLETIKECNYELYSIIHNYVISKEAVDKSGLLKNNYIENLKSDYKNIKFLIDKFKDVDKSFVVIAAGPSLDNELDILRINRNKFTIITVGTALQALMKKGITPDIIVIIDGKEAVAKQLQGFENEKIPLSFLSTASKWAISRYKGPKYMFYNRKSEDTIVVETGKTVAVAAISIAIHCNAEEIILLGQDLAFLNGKSHTNTYENIYGYKDKPIINRYSKLVKGINGKMLETTKGYIYFKEQIEKIIDLNKNIRFINCSKGAFIKGAKHIEFKKYIKEDM